MMLTGHQRGDYAGLAALLLDTGGNVLVEIVGVRGTVACDVYGGRARFAFDALGALYAALHRVYELASPCPMRRCGSLSGASRSCHVRPRPNGWSCRGLDRTSFTIV